MSTAAIVPRWEWRAFGDWMSAADVRLAGLPITHTEDTDELYLLSLDNDSSAKVRGGLMDVKLLEEVDADGLERWRPVLKAEFPLAPDEVGSVLAALGVEEASSVPGPLELEQLLDEVVRPSERLLAVAVHKRRRHYELDGCMAERTELRVGSQSTRTIAVESTDAARVIAVVRDLGLDREPNVCVARGLKTLVGFEGPRYAVVDVGTNSVKLLVGERQPHGAWRTVTDRAEITRLGEGVDGTGRLGAGPVARTVDAIDGMVDEARRDGAAEIAAVGTAVLRRAENAAELVEAVEQRSGVRIDVISGEEEARLAYLAATSALGPLEGSLVVFDTGGGSSQFTFGHGRVVDERFSVDLGAVRVSERHGLDGVVSEDALDSALDAIAGDLGRLDGHAAPDAVVAMGGVVTNLAAVKHRLRDYDPAVVQGTVLDRSEIDRQIELYRTLTAEERRRIVGLQPKRAEVILAGACIVRTVLEKLDSESLTVSDRGLRHGLLAERFGARPSA
jgi:exopolyphosphatase/guanosine-5'-triphosphate,3'-diphosphate pyrophosphatase